ncbi:hypothetical protein TPHA_0J02410 [Tetrapisispora phaffii CBS 4417]|uniref:Alpha-1,3/1,6-mannosyltransferase ALG2 n=1 Tax=Tetrapisispora phaffii (strain ATCC 24235 / CBS 4417 / NBRC 1672 / NRRL Y-8282 / UCD 70-5) TaxID=1071381 RepID=G8BYW9_TETPH|nr:hypothetical protein TPHA_0J02410 [Tetrapisispora phaffii CBS 4417]CCE65061.1 hypothetical protein TPHA_0J02410 [Tetrapisispora phaffii CBS 4417]
MLTEKLDIGFLHPDLGIGGAERLIVDAAVGLQEQGHNVTIYTSHCDKTHCFEEVKSGLLKVEVYGDSLPTTVYGKFYIIFSNLRQMVLVANLVLSGKVNKHDLFIVDQLSTCIPFLHLFGHAKILFYCHFPDQLLAIRSSLIKKLYRIPFDYLEQFTMGVSDAIIVNSKFTKSVYAEVFPTIGKEPHVIYPCVNTENTQSIEKIDRELLSKMKDSEDKFYLSINRFELKKNILLALQSFNKSNAMKDDHSKLVICGGYDHRVPDNIECLKELQKAATALEIKYSTIFYPQYFSGEIKLDADIKASKVIFLTSISGSLKELLLSETELLLYTPSNEHFGIVPLEAMNHGKPVLAANSGGPLETVNSLVLGENDDTATGWLRETKVEEWANAINECMMIANGSSEIYSKINFTKAGPLRIKQIFSRTAMTKSFEDNIDRIYWVEKYTYIWEKFVIILGNVFLRFIISNIFPNSGIGHFIVAIWVSYYFKSVLWAIIWMAAGLDIQFGDYFY